MKKILIVLLGLCISFSLFGCVNKQKSLGSFEEITYETCDALFESDATFLLVISQTTCDMCREYKAMLNEYVKENKINIVYIQTLWDSRFPDVEDTPTTMVVVNGVIRDSVVGNLNAEQLELLLKRNKVYYGSLSEISYPMAVEWFEKDKDFVFIVSQTTCTVCASYKEHLLEVIKELPIDFVYVEANRDYDTFKETLWDVYFPAVEDTPTTCIVKNGEVVDFVVGDLSIQQLVKLFDRNGVVYE